MATKVIIFIKAVLDIFYFRFKIQYNSSEHFYTVVESSSFGSVNLEVSFNFSNTEVLDEQQSEPQVPTNTSVEMSDVDDTSNKDSDQEWENAKMFSVTFKPTIRCIENQK